MKNYPFDKLRTKLKIKLESFLREFNSVCKDCSRKLEEIKIVFATKYLDKEQFVAFLEIAKNYFTAPILIGENRVQEAEEKVEFIMNKLPKSLKLLKWMMIGNLQKNKINKAIKTFSEIHSVDSLDLAVALDKRLERENKIMPIFLEVNVSGEETKYGFKMNEIDNAILTMKQLSNLTVKGLMTMAPYGGDLEEIRGIYRKLKELADRYKLQTSMGMSHDWKIAVEEGADMIRIGSRIFG